MVSSAEVLKIVTELAVLDVTPDGFVLRERAPGVSVAQIRAATTGRLVVPMPDAEVPEMTGV